MDSWWHEDENDLDADGMDASTRRRLKVGKTIPKGRKRPRSPLRNRAPYSLMNIQHDKGHAESLSGVVDWLAEAVRFATPGKEKRGKHDPVAYVLRTFFHSTPEFEASMEEKVARRNGWTVRGAWPTTGKHIFDWEFEVWGERNGGVVVKFTMWGQKGMIDGHTFTTTVATVGKLAPKFVRKYFLPMKAEAKEQAK